MSNPASASSTNAGVSGFGSTEWSLVLAAGTGQADAALNNLCRKYWRPMYVLVRRLGIGASDAEDVTQGFFVYLIEKDWIGQADPNKGSFRAFLRVLLTHYLANHKRVQNAARRTAPLVSIDTAEGEQALATLSPRGGDTAAAFDMTWARSVLVLSWERLKEEHASAGYAPHMDALRPFLTQAARPGDYEGLGRVLGVKPSQVAVIIHRLSRRYAEIIRAEVAETLADRSELEAELRHLLRLVAA